MAKYYSSERLKEITYTNEIQQDLYIYDRKNHDKLMTLIHDMDLEILDLKDTIENKNNCIEAYDCIIESRDKRIDKAIDKAQLIRDIGFDYDGFNDSESLKILIDELVKYAGDIKNILKGEE